MPGYSWFCASFQLSLDALPLFFFSPAASASASVWTLAEPLEHFYRVKKEISAYKNVPSPQVSARSNAISPTNMTAVNSPGWSSRLEKAKLSCLFRCVSKKLTECPSDLIGPINKLFMLQNSSERGRERQRTHTHADWQRAMVGGRQRWREWIIKLDECNSLHLEPRGCSHSYQSSIDTFS